MWIGGGLKSFFLNISLYIYTHTLYILIMSNSNPTVLGGGLNESDSKVGMAFCLLKEPYQPVQAWSWCVEEKEVWKVGLG